MKCSAILTTVVLTLAVGACSAKPAADLAGDATSSTAVKTHAPPDATSKSESKAHGSLSTGKKHHTG
jgi:hypothetical protein